MSYTVHHSTTYSDGKSDSSPFSFSEKRIGICYNCKQAFWKEDALSRDDPHNEKHEELPQSKDIFDLIPAYNENYQADLIRYYIKLIDENFANTTERKIFLKIQLWWAINDLDRGRLRWKHFYKINWLAYHNRRKLLKPKRVNKAFRKVFIENLENLGELILRKKEPDYYMLTEVYREQGKFRKAWNALKKVNKTQGSFYRKMRNAILLRKRKVFQLS